MINIKNNETLIVHRKKLCYTVNVSNTHEVSVLHRYKVWHTRIEYDT